MAGRKKANKPCWTETPVFEMSKGLSPPHPTHPPAIHVTNYLSLLNSKLSSLLARPCCCNYYWPGVERFLQLEVCGGRTMISKDNICPAQTKGWSGDVFLVCVPGSQETGWVALKHFN